MSCRDFARVAPLHTAAFTIQLNNWTLAQSAHAPAAALLVIV
jgi:hypothetical protein